MFQAFEHLVFRSPLYSFTLPTTLFTTEIFPPLTARISAKRGTDSKFEAEANHKCLVPKSKRICVRTNAEFCPALKKLEYYNAHTNPDK